MSAQKTKPSSQSAEAFIRAIADPARRKECRTLARIMKKATGAPGRVWGGDRVGFGSYHYK